MQTFQVERSLAKAGQFLEYLQAWGEEMGWRWGRRKMVLFCEYLTSLTINPWRRDQLSVAAVSCPVMAGACGMFPVIGGVMAVAMA